MDFFFFFIYMKYTEHYTSKMHLVEEKEKERGNKAPVFWQARGNTQGEQQ